MSAIASGRRHPMADSTQSDSTAAQAAAAASLPRLTTAQFEAQCLGDGPCLVELFEESCASCLQVLPAMGMAHLWLSPELPIAAVDVHHHFAVAQRLEITRLPALLAFHKGEMVRFPRDAPPTADNLISFYECVVYPDDECTAQITREPVPAGGGLGMTPTTVGALAIAVLMLGYLWAPETTQTPEAKKDVSKKTAKKEN